MGGVRVTLLPALLGMLLGLCLHWSCLSRPWHKPMLAFLSAVTALGWTLLGVCVLTWLAVLPPDSPGTLAFLLLKWSALFALTAWVCGFSPVTALAGFVHRPMEALCTVLGCLGGSLIHVDMPDFSAAVAPYAGWLGALCIVIGLIGVIVYLVRKTHPLPSQASPCSPCHEGAEDHPSQDPSSTQ